MSGAQSHADDELPAEPETDPKPAPPAITLRDGLRWALDVLDRLAVTDEDYEYGDGEPVNAGPVVAKLRALLGASVEPLAAVDLDATDVAILEKLAASEARMRAAEALILDLHGGSLRTCDFCDERGSCRAAATSTFNGAVRARCDKHHRSDCKPLPSAGALRAWLDLRGAS